MLTSATSQYYHHPEYVSPLPGTEKADRNKNPLILLAQTCSSIGKDSSPHKSSKSSSDHKDDIRSCDMNSVLNVDTHKKACDLKLDISPIKREISNTSDSEKASDNPRDVSMDRNGGRPDSTRSPTERRESPKCNVKSEPSSPASVRSESSHLPKTSTPTSDKSPHSKCSSGSSPTIPHYSGSSKVASIAPIVPGLPIGAGYGYPGFHDPRFSMLAHPSLYPSLGLSAYTTAGSSLANKHGIPPTSQHIAHSQPNTVPGIPPLVPICRDPHCSGCQASQSSVHTPASCTSPGCVQCTHERALANYSRGVNGLSGQHSVHPLHSAYSFPGLGGMTPGLHSLYSYAASSAQPGQSPCVCNWTSGSEYCGKRFSSPEELYQHLRTHTNETAYLLQNQAAFGLPLGYGIYPQHDAATSDYLSKAFQRSVSPGLLASSRFHPYKSPMTSVPPSAFALGQLPTPHGLSHPAHPLYGSKLGAIM